MFVRLFVDENLDRHVPISKQPKEKIQAIIDSCTRQFPEYSERSRKRIRTYLKSCRRTKRSREQAGLDINNVSSYHQNLIGDHQPSYHIAPTLFNSLSKLQFLYDHIPASGIICSSKIVWSEVFGFRWLVIRYNYRDRLRPTSRASWRSRCWLGPVRTSPRTPRG